MTINTQVTVNNETRRDHGRRGEVTRLLHDGLCEVWLFPVGMKRPLSWIFHTSELSINA